MVFLLSLLVFLAPFVGGEFLRPTEPTPWAGSVGATCVLSSAAGCHGAHTALIAEASRLTVGCRT